MFLSKKALLALLPFSLQVNSQASGTGVTTRYWDCCKPSCGWAGKATLVAGPVTSCDINDQPVSADTQSACPSGSSGSSYMCSTQQPWAVSDTLAYGFAATSIAGGTEATWCCACYALTFTSTSISGKTLIVQSTNTGSDLGSNQFDLAMPGGGSGIFDGCVSEWGNPSTGWGAQYGGISDRSDCDAFPAALQPGCHWRFEWFENANNPTVSFQQVECPAALTTKSGCVRANDSIDEAPTGASVTGGAAVTSSGSGSSTTTASGSTGGGSTTSSGTAAQYGQCGGTGWTGPTTCVSPYTCTYSSAYYSQCL